jgi:catabolite regulation protein CreA
MKYCCFLIVLLAAASFSCKQRTAVDVMPEMRETDSIEVLFFDKPEDQRNFTYVSSTDKQQIALLLENFQHPVRDSNDCAKTGKIYCHKKGQIFNTIYFSVDSCKFMRFIVNGELYYTGITYKWGMALKDLKQLARKPE